VALISTTATFRPWNQAGEQRPDLRGRPGINPLGFKTTYRIDAPALEQLRRISRELGFEIGKERARKHFYSDKEIADNKESEVDLLGHRFVQDRSFSIATEGNSRMSRTISDGFTKRAAKPIGLWSACTVMNSAARVC
jgi:poly-gamma-glutamate synthesis protein (capsule biosynthesis protein)